MHQEIGRRIRELRRKKSMLQEELASRAGLSASALSNFEQGRRRISLAWLRRIGKALGVTTADLIPESRSRRPLAETPEEEELVSAWRRLQPNGRLQDQLLSVMELVAATANHRRPRERAGRARPGGGATRSNY
jgi:transcriptional regulator with XRE-family HTH domain